MPTRILEHDIALDGLPPPGPAVTPPPGLRVEAGDNRLTIVQIGEDFTVIREHRSAALARALLAAAGPGARVALSIRTAAALHFFDAEQARRFFEVVRLHYPDGDYRRTSGREAPPEARFAAAWDAWRGRFELRATSRRDFRAAVRLQRAAAPAGEAAAALRRLEEAFEGWVTGLQPYGYKA